MIEGLVTRSYSNFFYVRTDGREIECVLRGKLKRLGKNILAGDRVLLTEVGRGSGAIEDVLPRRTALVRPPVANVDLALLVFCLTIPPTNTAFIDRVIVQAEAAGVEVGLCLNKIDQLDDEADLSLVELYRSIGYPVFLVSVKEHTGLSPLVEFIKGRVTVLAGQSGAGKSRLLNALIPGARMKTGEVSERLGSGRHTTRRVELVPLPEGGYLADTPGFSRIDHPPDIDSGDLDLYFKEFLYYVPSCRFSSCRHLDEPGCAVKAALDEGKIAPSRYESYSGLYDEIRQSERRY